MKSDHAHQLGYAGEEAVAEILRGLGYDVKWPTESDEDILINNTLTVEVKTATLSGRTDKDCKRWQFCLFSHPGRDKPFDEDLIILRCESDPPVHFIIPGMAVPPGLTKIDITSADPRAYWGKWCYFREDWGEIAWLLTHKGAQLWKENRIKTIKESQGG